MSESEPEELEPAGGVETGGGELTTGEGELTLGVTVLLVDEPVVGLGLAVAVVAVVAVGRGEVIRFAPLRPAR